MLRHPAFKTVPGLVFYAILCLLSGLALSWCQSGLVPVSFGILLVDGLIYSVLGGLLAWLLWYVVAFTDLTSGKALQSWLNRAALLVLLLVVYAGGGWLSERLFLTSASAYLSATLPLKLVYGLLMFILVIRWYDDRKIQRQEEDDEEQEDEPETLPEESVSPERLETITVRNGQKIHLLQVAGIHFLQADGDYVMIHTAEGRFLKEQTMKYFEEHLPSGRFVRIHRSCIVNTEQISKIELYEKQSYRITLKSGQQLKASMTGYRLLKGALKL